MRPGWLAVWLCVWLTAGCSGPEHEAGFAGLADNVQALDGFEQPAPGDLLVFPDDFGPHPAHRIEWWYLTANLQTEAGEPLGLQWTQFRQSIEPRALDAERPEPSTWPLQAAWMAHAAVSYQGQHWFQERLARGDLGQAGAVAEPFKVWLDHWQMNASDRPDHWQLAVSQGQPGKDNHWAFDLALNNQGQPVAHGDNGFSAKSGSGEGSMYFSLVNLEVTGTVTLAGEQLKVHGKAWFDREWSSQFLKAGQQGWDWFALHLDSGDKLMVFRLREEGGHYQSGTWIPRSGAPVALAPDQLRLEPGDGSGGVPTRWRLQVPAQGVDLELVAPEGDYTNDGLFPYWESPVSVLGSHSGVGYMELTGYGD
ncbi:lipocalin-like domain-containing protein [Marinobacter halophilus]|uniref:Carotenoid 1,2-hydratase n=1 Tax=Marinobacter halophilus TaxID=1323740 RepID=A0A2T1KJ70_9GAMM|nr:lipocalin-like domain-containing protein [Marinobacter halophilus]PSF10191.1 carotenoid 1,2-hydratase [Marinobacter halophilus]GGC68490.1 iron ABC transporter permease [Marinobacter halophilus]